MTSENQPGTGSSSPTSEAMHTGSPPPGDTAAPPAPSEGAPTEALPRTAVAPGQPDASTPAAPETAIQIPGGTGAATDSALSVPMTGAEEAPAWLEKADWILIGLAVVLSVLLGSLPVFNSDVWMHLATGRLIAQGEYSFGADPFACSTEAHDGHEAAVWVNHAWLFDLGLYFIYSVFGGAGIAGFKAIVTFAVAVLMLQFRTRNTSLLLVAICMVLGVLTLSVRLMFLQPVLASYFMLGLTLCVLHRAGVFEASESAQPDPKKSRLLWWLPALFLLWVNLDNWFILGPITLGLCWAGLAIARWRGLRSTVKLRQIGMVFGVGLLVCVVNPFHVRAFQLPAELAYLLVRAADVVSLPLPDAIAGGGRTLATLRDYDPSLPVTLSPLSSKYLFEPVGWNIAGWCFVPLLVLGVLSFAINGIAAATADGPAMQPARFFVWLFFAMLAVSMYRLLPLFAIVAGPIAAINLSEFLTWFTRPIAGSAPPQDVQAASASGAGTPATLWDAPVRMARLLGVPLMLVLWALAWPGWLNGPFEMGSRRHVWWEVVIDPSMRLAAESLSDAEKQKKHAKVVRAFNIGVDFPNYCAWYAPQVKCFLDSRFNLFGEVVRDYAVARRALLDKDKKKEKEWIDVLSANNVDHVVVENFIAGSSAASWWVEAPRWKQGFADRHVAVFTWSGGDRFWPSDSIIEQWNVRAFGPVAVSDRPPPKGPPPPPEERGLADRYAFPPLTLPQSGLELDMLAGYSQFVVPRAIGMARISNANLQMLIAGAPTAPGGVNTGYTALAAASVSRLFDDAKVPPPFVPIDTVPPAATILFARLAWHTVAESPGNERCYRYLAHAYTRINMAEKYWTNPKNISGLPTTLRDSLRRLQIVTALRTAAEAGFSEPQWQYQVHQDLAATYFEQHYIDRGLDHLNLAAQVLDSWNPGDGELQKAINKDKADLEAKRKFAETEVKQRKTDFDLKSATKTKLLDKVRIALGPYKMFTKDNKEVVDPSRGLVNTALDLLNQVDPQSLSPEEQIEWVHTTLDILFNLGDTRQAGKILEKWKDALGPLAFRFEVFRAGTQGDYDDLRAVLAAGEKQIARETVKMFAKFAATTLPSTYGQTAAALSLNTDKQREFNWAFWMNNWGLYANEYFNVMTLRGIVTLEAGDTAEAYRIFSAILRESDVGAGWYFIDRPIAERYHFFLEKYQKR